MKRLSSAAVLAASVLLLAACGGSGGGTPITVSGSVLIEGRASFTRSGSSCTGTGLFAPVREGASVTADEDATGTLAGGSVTGEGNCRFRFEVELPDKEGALKRYDFRVEGLPSVTGLVNTQQRIDWQSPGADGWVTIGWGS